MDYYVPAYISLVIASIGVVTLPVHITTYREHGILRRFRASSIPLLSVLGAHIIVSFAIAILGGVLLYFIAWITSGASLPKTPGLVIPALLLGSLSFSTLGFLLGAILPTTRLAQVVGLILFFVMLILGGAGPPREVMTEAMRIIGDITPLRHVILAVQDPWLGLGWNVNAMLIMFGIIAGSTLLSIRFFRWE